MSARATSAPELEPLTIRPSYIRHGRATEDERDVTAARPSYARDGRAEADGVTRPAAVSPDGRLMLRLARYHRALTDALPLAGSRAVSEGPTTAELALEAEFARQAAVPLLGLYQQSLTRLDALMTMSAPDITAAVLDDYAARPTAVARLNEVYHAHGRQAFDLGGQMGLNALGLLGRFEVTDSTILDAIDAEMALLTELEPGAERSTVVTTAAEIGREVARRREDGIDAADLLPLLSAWVLARTVIRTAVIAATESVRMSRWGMVWAFAGNGVRGVRHLCESDVFDRCGGAICPPLCGTEYALPGVFDPMGAIPAGATIPLHPKCRCSWEPLTDGWLKPALIWTGFALDMLLDGE